MATLSSGQCLQPGQSLQSDNQLHTLIMQTDGNVVLYDRHSQPLWSTDTGGLITPGHFAMQTDGNLVLYDTTGYAKWASNTQDNPGAFLNIQDDGNLVVYRAGAQAATAENALWAAGSNDWADQAAGGGASNSNGGAGQAAGDGSPTEAEATLAHLINNYRMQYGLAAIPISRSLTKVAQAHAKDLFENRPDQGTDERGHGCNLHSWSAQGNWSPVCYTDDHIYSQAMWNKPREITNNAYTGNGYEISMVSSEQVQPEAALASWQSSSGHNDVIVEGDIWANKNWPAFGVGMYGNYAVAWFGDNPE
jgi:uncharacterized protein YkwD